jgi:hypothetical protein
MVGSAAAFDATVLGVDRRSAPLASDGRVARDLSSEIVRRRLARRGRACRDGFLHARWPDGFRREASRES